VHLYAAALQQKLLQNQDARPQNTENRLTLGDKLRLRKNSLKGQL